MKINLERLWILLLVLVMAAAHPGILMADCEDGPDAADDQISITRMAPHVIDVLANDSHPCGSPLKLSSFTVLDPANCGANIDDNLDGTLSFVPHAGFTTNCDVTYTIEDQGFGSLGVRTASATLTLIPPGGGNEPPPVVILTEIDERRKASLLGINAHLRMGPEVIGTLIVEGEQRTIATPNLTLLGNSGDPYELERENFYWDKILSLLALHELGELPSSAVEDARRLMRFQFSAYPGVDINLDSFPFRLQVRNQAMRVFQLYGDTLFPDAGDPSSPNADLYELLDARLKGASTRTFPMTEGNGTENHQTIENSFGLLSMELAGVPATTDEYLRFRSWWLDHFRHAIEQGFHEWGNSGYFHWTLSALLNLAEFSADEQIRNGAQMTLDYQLAIQAEQSAEHGGFGSAAVRLYPWAYFGNIRRLQTHLAQTLFTGGDFVGTAGITTLAVDFAVSNYQPLQLVNDAFLDVPSDVTARFLQHGRFRGSSSPWFHHNYRGTTYTVGVNVTPRRGYYNPHDTAIAFIKSRIDPFSHVTPFGFFPGSAESHVRDQTTHRSERGFGYRNVVIYTHGGIRPGCPLGSTSPECNPPNQPPRLHVTSDFNWERVGNWAFLTNGETYVGWLLSAGVPEAGPVTCDDVSFCYGGYFLRSSHQTTTIDGVAAVLEVGDAASFGSYIDFKNNLINRNSSFNGQTYQALDEQNQPATIQYHDADAAEFYRYSVNGFDRSPRLETWPRAESPHLDGNQLTVGSSSVVFDATSLELAGDTNRIESGFTFGEGFTPTTGSPPLLVSGTQPAGAAEGDQAHLWVTVSGGNPPYEYVWEKQFFEPAMVWLPISGPGISGENTELLQFDPAHPDHAGKYRCRVSDGTSTINGPAGQLSVIPLVRAPILEAEMADSLAVDEDGNGSPSPGDTLLYTISIENVGNDSATDLEIFAPLDPNTVLVSGSEEVLPGGASSTTASSVTVNVATLAAGGTLSVLFEARIDDSPGIGLNHVATQAEITSAELPLERTDDPNTPVLDDATRTLLAPPVLNTDIAMALESLGEGLSYKAGALAIFGWATAHDGLIDVNLETSTDADLESFTYGWPRPDICQYTQEVFGYTDPNCPRIGFKAIINTRDLKDSFPAVDPHILHLEATSANGNTASRSQSFSLQSTNPATIPTAKFSYPQQLPVTASELEKGSDIRLHGWALDTSGILKTRFIWEPGTADARAIDDMYIAYGVTRRDGCAEGISYEDPNCRVHDFSRVGWEILFDTSDLMVGDEHSLRMEVEDAYENTTFREVIFEIVDHDPEQPARPFLDEPIEIGLSPRSFDFADYDLGGQGFAYGDHTPNNDDPGECLYRGIDDGPEVYADLTENGTCRNLWVAADAGEWLGFTADIAEAGYYKIAVQLESEFEGSIHFALDGVPVTEPDDVVPTICDPIGGDCLYFAYFPAVYLEPGIDGGLRQLQVVVDEGQGATLKSAITVRVDDPESIHFPITLPIIQLGPTGTIVEAEDYDTSPIFIGQKVGYRDASPGNQASSEFPEREYEWVDAMVEGQRLLVTDLEVGEWLDYSLEVVDAGTYDLELQFANISSADGFLDVLVDGVARKAVAIPSTGGGWLTGVMSDVALSAGEHVLKLAPGGGASYKIDYVRIKEPTSCPATADDDGFGPGNVPLGTFTVPYGQSWTDHGWALSLANDTPAGELSLPVITRYPQGSLEIDGNDLIYHPPAEFQTADSFEYSVFSDDDPACEDTATVHLTLSPPTPPIASFIRDCFGLACTLNAEGSTGEGLTYEWLDLGDGIAGEGEVIDHSYSSHDTYTATLKVTDLAGQSHSASGSVVMVLGSDDARQVTFGSTLTIAKASLLTNDLGPFRQFDSVATQPSNGQLSELGADLLYTPTTCAPVDSFDYTLTVFNPSCLFNCSRDQAAVRISILPDDPPAAALVPACEALECSFSDESSDANGYHLVGWDFGDGTFSELPNPPHTYATAGVYQVRLVVADSCGQVSTASQSIAVEEPPEAAFEVVCHDLTCHYDASSSSDDVGIVSYLWEFGDGTSSEETQGDHTYATEGEYTLELRVTDSVGQSDFTEQALEVVDLEENLSIILFAGSR